MDAPGVNTKMTDEPLADSTERLRAILDTAIEAIATVVKDGIDLAMSRFNGPVGVTSGE